MMVRPVCRAGSIFLAVVAVLVVGSSPARAQSLRPNILFIFDTSGSMRDTPTGMNTGEGTNICAAGTTSRIYNLKSALRAALAQSGTDEANFGLMSFPETVSNTFVGGACSTGHYNTSATQTITTPNRVATGNHTATAFGGGCLMSTNVNNETTFGPWFNNGAAQVLRVGVTTAAPGVTPIAANYDPADANIGAIFRWIDNFEFPTANGAVTDPELHANGLTPLGRSLFYARMYFDGVVKPNDPRGACRQNVVVLVTDGADTCDESTAPDNTFSLTTCLGGAAFEPYHPVVQACQLFRTSNIKMYMITDSGLTAPELVAADRIAAAGGTGSAIRVTLTDANAAKAAIAGIIAATVPPAETCNGVDDNCNGLIDEGVSNSCTYNMTDPNDPDNMKGTGAAHCAVEIPNCLDDNCNGLIDEGFPQNACGTGAASANCLPPEICDGIDNNCNGVIDEPFDIGGSCNNGLSGACRRIGIKECSPDKMGYTCNLSGAPVTPEVCNGIDDDCDGQIDNGLGPTQGIGVDCGIQGQGCTKGVTVCDNGKITCNSVSNPQQETCNGVDDDCNGIIDDGIFPGVGDSCLCPGLAQASVGVGLCRAGRLACKGVEGVKCDGCVLPQPEVCDGKDNDCDGMVDTTAACPTGFGCRDGACGLLCKAGEFSCPPGYDCIQSYCVPNRCKNVQCPSDQKCDNDTGSCVDLCYKVSCLTGQTCMHGACYDCSNSSLLACATGQVCINRQCVVDKCAGLHCSSGQYCSDGTCVSLSCSPACKSTEKCIAGVCSPYNCATVGCSSSAEYCDYVSGTCKPDMCAAKTCPYCVMSTGECTPDPCANIGCPNDGCWNCLVTPTGQPYCELNNTCGYAQTKVGNTGGGCSCEVSTGNPLTGGGVALALLGLTIFARRRRRR